MSDKGRGDGGHGRTLAVGSQGAGLTSHSPRDGGLVPGQVLEGKYEILAELGAGAMGVVYAARHRALGKRVAIKTIVPELSRDNEVVRRFEREARAASAIGHPNIVQVFDLGKTPDGSLFMVMELLDGETLADRLERENVLDPAVAVKVAAQTLSGLHAAHQRGIVHRDLKPSNIAIVPADEPPGLVKVLDFGISKVIDASDPSFSGGGQALAATSAGTLLGTPLYMAPEQARGRSDLDQRVDIWAMGCVLYEMVCGRPPFLGENYHQILGAIIDGTFRTPSEIRKGLPPGLDQVIRNAMSLDREGRYRDAQEMRRAVLACLGAGDASSTAPAPDLDAETLLGSLSGDVASTQLTTVDGESIEPELPPEERQLDAAAFAPPPDDESPLLLETEVTAPPPDPTPTRSPPRLLLVLVLLILLSALTYAALLALGTE